MCRTKIGFNENKCLTTYFVRFCSLRASASVSIYLLCYRAIIKAKRSLLLLLLIPELRWIFLIHRQFSHPLFSNWMTNSHLQLENTFERNNSRGLYITARMLLFIQTFWLYTKFDGVLHILSASPHFCFLPLAFSLTSHVGNRSYAWKMTQRKSREYWT